MKTTIKILFYSIILFVPIKNWANPLVPFNFNELYFDSGGWIIELNDLGIVSLNGWFLTSGTDTAYFNDDLTAINGFFLITQDSLQSTLNINPLGDILTLFDFNGFQIDQLSFGEASSSMIAAPLSGQSICGKYNLNNGDIIYYLDNTPTIGEWNDSTNAMGFIDGVVTDSLGNPLSDVEVVYDYYDDFIIQYDISVFTDNNGYFILNDMARLVNLKIRKQNYETCYYDQQIWPDSTVAIDTVVMLSPVSDVEEKGAQPEQFYLSQNYPNPFNPTTNVEFRILDFEFVSLKIYDVLGKEVVTLISEEMPAGQYTFYFDARSLSSGVYYYRLKTDSFVQTKKMILLK